MATSKRDLIKHACPFEQFLHDLPTPVLVNAVLDAQNAACESIAGMERNAARVELFWLTYNFEFHKQIERWIKESANIKT